MASFVRARLFPYRQQSDTDNNRSNKPGDHDDEFNLEDEHKSDRPYIINSIYYLTIILFLGVPMWYFTCSSIRYSLPDISVLESKLLDSYRHQQQPRVHLDISVVQLTSSSTQNNINKVEQAEYLRKNLPVNLDTSVANVSHSINWRIRRPTQDENHLFKSILKDESLLHTTDEGRKATFTRIRHELLKIHKPSNRFRLFVYLFDEPYYSLICKNSSNTLPPYLIDFERFVYLCTSDNNDSLVETIKRVLDEVYVNTVDSKQIRRIMSAGTDLLVSFVPENTQVDLNQLSLLTNTIHKMHEKNVKKKYLELTEVVNIRLITQNIFDLMNEKLLSSMILQPAFERKEAQKGSNSSNTIPTQAPMLNDSERVIKPNDKFYNEFLIRLNKRLAQSVHHVLIMVPDSNKPRMIFYQQSSTQHNNNTQQQTPPSYTTLLEERDSNFMLIGDSDKALALGMRAIIRRVVGLKSQNLCKNCLVQRDVFLNKWELDAVIGALTLLKLQSVLVSIRSISQQSIGIKIPKYVSSMAHESCELAIKAVDNLELKKPLEAFRLANSAYELSESAFYDPSLLETLYFPDEAKYAIYLPLFLPLVFPFAMSIGRICKFFFHSISDTKNREKVD